LHNVGVKIYVCDPAFLSVHQLPGAATVAVKPGFSYHHDEVIVAVAPLTVETAEVREVHGSEAKLVELFTSIFDAVAALVSVTPSVVFPKKNVGSVRVAGEYRVGQLQPAIGNGVLEAFRQATTTNSTKWKRNSAGASVSKKGSSSNTAAADATAAKANLGKQEVASFASVTSVDTYMVKANANFEERAADLFKLTQEVGKRFAAMISHFPGPTSEVTLHAAIRKVKEDVRRLLLSVKDVSSMPVMAALPSTTGNNVEIAREIDGGTTAEGIDVDVDVDYFDQFMQEQKEQEERAAAAAAALDSENEQKRKAQEELARQPKKPATMHSGGPAAAAAPEVTTPNNVSVTEPVLWPSQPPSSQLNAPECRTRVKKLLERELTTFFMQSIQRGSDIVDSIALCTKRDFNILAQAYRDDIFHLLRHENASTGNYGFMYAEMLTGTIGKDQAEFQFPKDLPGQNWELTEFVIGPSRIKASFLLVIVVLALGGCVMSNAASKKFTLDDNGTLIGTKKNVFTHIENAEGYYTALTEASKAKSKTPFYEKAAEEYSHEDVQRQSDAGQNKWPTVLQAGAHMLILGTTLGLMNDVEHQNQDFIVQQMELYRSTEHVNLFGGRRTGRKQTNAHPGLTRKYSIVNTNKVNTFYQSVQKEVTQLYAARHNSGIFLWAVE
jgi:hypothetical protein